MREQAAAEKREEKKLDEKLRKMGEVKRAPPPSDEINPRRKNYSSDPQTRRMQIQLENASRKGRHNLEIMNRCSASGYKDCDLDQLVE